MTKNPYIYFPASKPGRKSGSVGRFECSLLQLLLQNLILGLGEVKD
jgi:hypothetical protein